MKKFFLMSLLGLLTCIAAVAQRPQAGKYYRIVNQNPDKAITTSGVSYGFCITEDQISTKLSAKEQGDSTQYNQLWKFDNDMFQNALTQRYIGSVYGSTQAETSSVGSPVSIEVKGRNYLIKSGNGQYLHADGGNAVVGWYDTANPSNWWKFEAVNVDDAALKLAQDEYKRQQEEKGALEAIVNQAAKIAPIVEGYFQDKACTTLKAEYAAMSDADFKAKMTTDELPEQVQTMVLGIKNKWKDEFNPVMSERFRVQSYKVYTRCDDAGSNPSSPKWTVNAGQMSDRNNPTGIWTDALQLMYVFVDSEIPAGTTLKIAGATGSGVIGLFDWQGTELKPGMNIIYCGLNYTTQWIMYTCAANYNKPLSEYPEIKIHIEGGEVLGYVNKHVSGDEVSNAADEAATNAEYEEVFKNAVALMNAKKKDKNAINFTVMGERGVFEFPVETYRKIWADQAWRGKVYGYKIYKSLNFYDNVLKWEWSNMGWQDRVEGGKADNDLEHLGAGGGDAFWPTYINNHAPTMQCPGDKNPYSGNSHTGMPGDWGVESSYNAERADFDTWCCGHESGHNNQSTINLPSCTESSNNYFSNIITVQYGYRLSRGWSFAQNFDAYGYGKTVFSQRDISITMRMWYNLWLYYHVAGHNKSFSPKLFKLLRQNPIQMGGEGYYNGKNGGGNRGNATTSWLRFYEVACEAAGEDLTEFFRMWGFLTPTAEAEGDYIEVIDGKYYAYCGDYASYYVHSEKADIEAAIKRVKDKGYKENLAVMFIEDRQIPRKRHDPWANGTDYKPFNWDVTATAESMQREYGNVGDVLTLVDGSANESNYKYILSGNRIKLSGKGGMGFIVYDMEGNIIYMANKLEFDLPAEVAAAGFTIKTVNGNSTMTEVIDMGKDPNATDSEKLMVLQAAVELAKSHTALKDLTGRKVGLYGKDVIAPLEALVAQANAVISDKDVNQYQEIAKKLNDEVLRLQVENLKTHIEPYKVYTINSVRKTGLWLAIASKKVGTSSSQGSLSSKWLFVPVPGKQDMYYLQNRSSKQFIGSTLNEKGNSVVGVVPAAEVEALTSVVRVEDLGEGKMGIRPMDKTYINIDPYGNMAMWGSGDEGSQWVIREAGSIDEVTDAICDEMVGKSNKLIADVADITAEQTLCTLQTDRANEAGYLSTNAPGTGNNTLNKAIDSSTSTYFQSDNSTYSEEDPYLMIDLGEGNGSKGIQFNLLGKTLGSRTLNYAKTMVILGSNDATTWTKVGAVEAETNDFQSPAVRASVPYRYWRIDVTSVDGNNKDAEVKFFTVADFKLNEYSESVAMKPAFTSLDVALVTDLMDKMGAASAQLGASFRTALSDFLAYEAMVKAYEALHAPAIEIDPTVNINGIEADKAADSAIYDLSGRKVSKSGKSGIYIINGKKVMR